MLIPRSLRKGSFEVHEAREVGRRSAPTRSKWHEKKSTGTNHPIGVSSAVIGCGMLYTFCFNSALCVKMNDPDVKYVLACVDAKLMVCTVHERQQ